MNIRFGYGWIFLLWICHSGILMANPDAELSWIDKVGARIYPQQTKTYNVAGYGAVGDGVTLNTGAIQKAIDECSLNGGGIVTFSPGRYLTGSIYLKEGVHFIIPENTTLLGSTEIENYPDIDTRVAGLEMVWPSALINVLDQKNVMISGNGTVHGQGKVFWESYWNMRKEYETRGLRWIVDYDCKRPRTLLVSNSSDVTVKGITFQQAGFWTVQILYSTHCTVDNITIQNNIDGSGPSTDGVNIDSSSYILVENADIDCNDDNICLKAGRDADGLRVNRPTEYIVVRNCISRAGAGLLTCGSETSGYIRYVYADALQAKGTNVGIRLKSALNRGGGIEHIYIKNVEMNQVGTVLEASMNWHPAYSYSALPEEFAGKTLPDHWYKMLEQVDEKDGIPYFSHIYLEGVEVTGSKRLMNVAGCESSRMKNFAISNVKGDVENAGYIAFAKDWTIKNMHLNTQDQQPITIKDSENVTFTGGSYPGQTADM